MHAACTTPARGNARPVAQATSGCLACRAGRAAGRARLPDAAPSGARALGQAAPAHCPASPRHWRAVHGLTRRLPPVAAAVSCSTCRRLCGAMRSTE